MKIRTGSTEEDVVAVNEEIKVNSAAILVVEDDEGSSALLGKILQRCGYGLVGITDTGEEAIRLAEEIRPDLVLMDIGLRGAVDGIEAARLINEHNNIPVVYITGGADDETFERAKKTMPFGYILKPFNMDILRTTIAMALYRSDAEKKLKESEDRNREILSSIPDLMFNLDIEGRFVSEIDASIAGKFWNKEMAGMCRDRIAEAAKTGRMQIFEYSVKRQSVLTHYEARIINSGAEIFLVIVRDITERKNAELELDSYRNNLEKLVAERTADLSDANKILMKEIKLREDVEQNLRVFSHTINQSSHCAVILKSDASVEYVNRAFVQLSGYSETELDSIRINEKVNPVLSEPEVWENITAGDVWKGELYNLTRDGRLYYLAADLSSIKNEEGDTTHYVILAEDITERKTRELALTRARDYLDKSQLEMADMELEWRDWKEKMLARNSSRTDKSLFRNINNSFTQGAGFGSLISLLELLDNTAEKQDGRFSVDAEIYKLVMNNLHIAQDAFKTFINIDWIISNDFKLGRISFSEIYDFIKVTIAGIENYCAIKKQRILINDLIYGYNDICFNINNDFLYKALYEGLINAMKFSKPGTNIIVFVYIHSRNLVISIVNDPEPGENGIIGIPVEYGKVIFEPFYRLSKLVFEQYKTLDFGLGLTLIEKIIQKHGGDVVIHNVMDHTDLRREPQTKVDLTISLPVAD